MRWNSYSFALGRLTGDSHRILAAIQRLAFVRVERGFDLGAIRHGHPPKFGAASFAHGKYDIAFPDDTKLALGHEPSLQLSGQAAELVYFKRHHYPRPALRDNRRIATL